MSKENTNCKQRFKAIEGFLRRVAFNLGNTPSQTEVKIISCIPIDVTDLQQKIFQLEKELEEAKQNQNTRPAANTNIASRVSTSAWKPCTHHVAKRDERNIGLSCCRENNICNESTLLVGSPGGSTSTVSLICQPACDHEYPFYSDCISNVTVTDGQGKESECRRSIFSRKKKNKKRIYTTQNVYYAQTSGRSPLINSVAATKDANSEDSLIENSDSFGLTRSYLAEMIQKQYNPDFSINAGALNLVSNFSDISTPVCRDNVPRSLYNCPLESETCSCCHSRFQDIDNHLNRRDKVDPLLKYPTDPNLNLKYNRSMYYDSNFYDVVPVKEKPEKIRNNMEMPRRRKPKKKSAKNWAENTRVKRKAPLIVVNRTAPIVRDQCHKSLPVQLMNKKEVLLNNTVTRRAHTINAYGQRVEDKSKKCTVNFNSIYNHLGAKYTNSIPNTSTKRDDKPCLVTTDCNTDCLKTTASVATSAENKTEITLNQIKSILQSVLNEVKTNSKFVKTPQPCKKDAVVQNGSSQNNVYGVSEMLQSVTYSPYNMNPYLPSRSQQICSNCTYSGMPFGFGKCVQQYPLLIQPQKHMCTNCYRNTNDTKTISTKHAATAATNTELIQERSKETEKLIREIYKSMALNVEIPTTNDKCYERHSNQLVKVESMKKAKPIISTISEIFRNTKQPVSSETPNTDTTVISMPNSQEERSARMNSSEKVISSVKAINEKDVETEQLSEDLESEDQSDDTAIKDDTEQSSIETESDDLVVNVQEPNKTNARKSLFNKMLKIFKPRERKTKPPVKQNKETDKEDESEKESSESDSDDYQTVYSHKVNTTPKEKVVNARSRPHSKVFYAKQHRQKTSRTRSPLKITKIPYMEQENRRHWNEKLMFHEHQNKKFSAEVSRDTTFRKKRISYPQNYEARRTFLESTTPRMADYGFKGNHAEIPNTGRFKYNYDGINSNYPGNFPNYPAKACNYNGTQSNYPRYQTNYLANEANYSVNNANYAGNSASYARPTQHGIHINYKNKCHNANNSNITPPKPHFITPKVTGRKFLVAKGSNGAKGLTWLKKQKLGLKCGEQWKKILIEG